ncbi:MAG: PD-(D/E)XK nuclease domain-containing protein, partial [Spirochaetaceae bacterium]|nr:PD-(D/E)XK nuclease domain-containing protein [Spirochaetaceae bacterium]
CAAGRGRVDLAIEYAKQWHIIEIKLLRAHDSPEEILAEGLAQISRYRDRIAPQAPAYLFIFDRRPETRKKPWDERISWKMEGTVRVVGC